MLIGDRNGIAALVSEEQRREAMYKELYEKTVMRTPLEDATQGNEGITSIASYAYYYAVNLKAASFPNVTSIGDYAFYQASKLAFASFPSVTTIATYVFWYCKFTEFVAPGLTTIGAQSFKYSYIQNIDYPLLTTMGAAPYQGCGSLKTANLPSLTAVPGTCFYSCGSLRHVAIPTATSIGANAFNGCKALQVIDLSQGSAVATLANVNAMSGVPATCKIVVPDALVDSYKADSAWSGFADRIISRSDAISGGYIEGGGKLRCLSSPAWSSVAWPCSRRFPKEAA